MSFLSSQIVISGAEDIGGGVSGNTGESNRTVEPSDG